MEKTTGPFTTVRALPIAERRESGKMPNQPAAVPVLFMECESGEVVIHGPALAWATASLGIDSLTKIVAHVKTIARFHEFVRVFIVTDNIDVDKIDYLISAYLMWRHAGTM